MPDCFIQKWMYLLSVCLLSTASISAQQSDTLKIHTLTDVEVVARKRPSVTRQGAPLQLMDRGDIERLGLQDLSEAVKRFSGVTVKDYGGIGGLKTVSIRSLGTQHTAVSYDGVTVSNTQSGQIDISRFSLDNVESVSLSIGQADDIFQTARMFSSAGVLNIRTSGPSFSERSSHIKAQLKGGSFGHINPYLCYEQSLGSKWSASVHGDYMRADGEYPFTLVNGSIIEEKKRKNSDIESWRAEINLFGNLGEGEELSLKGYYFDSERGLPGSVILYNDYAKERLWDKNAFVQGYYKKEINEQWAMQAQAKYNYTWNRYLDINNKYPNGKQDDRYTQHEYYASASGKYMPGSKITFTLAEDVFINTLDNTLPECPFPTRLSSLTVLAGQYKDSRVTVTASLLGTFATDWVEQGDRPKDRKRISPAASISWRVLSDQNIRLRASVKDGYWIPTFNDLYYTRIGNTNLRPERATQYNVGLTWNGSVSSFIPAVSLSADAYYNQVKDKIVATPTMFVWKMTNMGEVSIKGIDLNLSTQLDANEDISIYLQGTYSFQKAIDISNKVAKNYKHQIPYTPKHSGTVSVSVANPWVTVGYMLTAVGDRYALPQNIKENKIDRYVEQTISANREFHIKNTTLRLQAEVVNLGDVNYEVIHYYPMPGRSYRFTLMYIF